MQLRNKIDKKYKWNLDSIIANDEEIEEIFKIMENYISIIPKYKGKLNDRNQLYELLTKYEKYEHNIQKLGYYLYNSLNVDANDIKILRLINRYETLSTKISIASSYIQSELHELSDEYLMSLASEKRFSNYDNYFKDIIKLKPHKLSEYDSLLLSKMSKFLGNNSNIHSILSDNEMKFKDAIDSQGKAHKLNNITYSKLLCSKDRTLKKNTFESMLSGYKDLNKTFASIYINDIEIDKFQSNLEKYTSLLEKELFTNNMPREVFDNIIKHTNKNIPIMNRFIKALKKKLNLKDFSYYDLFQKNEISGKISIESAQDNILDALTPLGEEYLSLVKNKFTDQSIDYLPNKDKNSLAYCTNIYGEKTLILMNYLYDFDSITTLAHEMGHCINAEYYNSAQPKTKADITVFFAEIASIVNEILLLNKYIVQSKGKEKEAYLYKLLDTIRKTIYTQVLFSEFEVYAHNCVEQDIPITHQELNDFYFDLKKKYYGKVLKLPKLIQFEWASIPHFYEAYYVISYATGLVTAICIVKKILSDNNFSEKYIKFLKNGTNKPDIEMLKEIGIDLTTDTPYEIAFNYIKDCVLEYEKLINTNKK